MEPIAVLSLVANIVQLVDAAGKAFTICREIYTMGRTIEDSRMASTSEHLLHAYDHLTAEALQDELDSLRKSPGGGLRSTIQKARLKIIKAKTIDKLKLTLDEYQKTLDSTILIDVRQALDALGMKQEGQSKNLEQQLSQVSSDLKSCRSGFAIRLRSEIDKHITASEAQHVVTREKINAHVTRTMQDLSFSQREQLSEQTKRQHSMQQYDQIRNSLWFNEIHTRMNDIEESHADTFQWIFQDDKTYLWDSFSGWLKEGSQVYWISGKAGSGKSTLMRFLVEDSRTGELLAQWSLGRKPLVIKFYFWLSGTEMQRSLKGFLCSVIYQLVHEDKLLIEQLLSGDAGLLSKRNPGDWSKKELRTTLVHSIGLLDRPLCIFLDGLDEFSQDDDVGQILNLLDDVSKSGTTKICVSSRPEPYIAKRMKRYKQLQLQDLTAKDMDLCIRTTLEYTRTQCLPAFIDDKYLDRIISLIAKKADGVFLWVHYALSSLVRGMRNEDTFGDLLRRIERLPSGMHQLYLQMWNRLNEDKKHYQEEAATYFSYVATWFEFKERVPISLFELLVALDPQLQISIVDELKPQDPIVLNRDCEALKTRVLTRTAGLLEFSMDSDTEEENRHSTPSSWSAETMNYTYGRARSLSGQSHQSLSGSASQNKVDFVTGIRPRNDQAFAAGNLYSSGNLAIHYRSKLKYLHRTARDFLMETEDGQKLSGNPPDLPVTMSNNILRARMAALVQGYMDFEGTHVAGIISDIKFRFRGHPDPEHETVLIVALRRVCQSLSTPGIPEHHIGYSAFWVGAYASFECCAVYFGFPEYVQKFVQDRSSYIDPYGRGLLALYAASTNSNRATDVHYARTTPLISWLASNGADLHTPQTDIPYGYNFIIPRSPATVILCALDRLARLEEETTIRTRRPDISKEPPTRVLLVYQGDGPYSSFSYYAPPDWCCPSEGDSLYLGEALEAILFENNLQPSSNQALVKDFGARVGEVRERSPTTNMYKWKEEYVMTLERERKFADASGLSPEKLRDRWFV
ncbi:MAG: hypothetical protein L6R42_001051 [Xanthoria sp. 1 TBL-2021]|nr:MAG: hypothetical protein L6R42_001051 [Xanthoria sp. 1 TBL-2021]